jgi:hypothetical protein
VNIEVKYREPALTPETQGRKKTREQECQSHGGYDD